MADLTTNFNVNPYYDDYDETKDFARILFVPSRAVQARELTQIQTMMQKQIQRQGDNLFKNGTVVQGCAVTYEPKFDFVRLKNNFNNNLSNNVFDDTLENFLLVSNTGVRASVRKVSVGYESLYPDTNKFYVNYLTTGNVSNTSVSTFQSGESLTLYTVDQAELGILDANNVYNTINVITSNATVNCIGQGYGVTVGDGIIYQKGFFLRTDQQTIIVTPNDTNVNGYSVGYNTVETIITHTQDDTLNDPSNGISSNAPGADRLVLTPKLVAYNANTIPSDAEFFPIIEFSGNTASEQSTNTVYNVIGDQIARGIKEASGNYVVKPFIPSSTVNSANNDLIDYNISSGVGYVNGYRVETLSTKSLTVDRAITTDYANSQIITANYGKYVFVNEVLGAFDHESAQVVNIYDTAQRSITQNETPASAPSGSVVGTANIRALQYDNGVKGSASCQYRFYIFNIKMNSGKSFSSDAKSFVTLTAGTYGYARADIVLSNSAAVINDATNNSLVFNTGATAIKTLRAPGEVNDNQFIYRQISSATLQSNGSAVFTLSSPASGGVERISLSSVSDSSEEFFNFITSAALYSVDLTGTVAISGNVVTGTSTTFDSVFANGDYIRVNSSSYLITAVTNSTSLQLSTSATVASGNTYQKYWPAGSYLNSSGGSGSISINSNTQFTYNFSNVTIGSGSQTIYGTYPVLRTTAVEIKKVANKNRYVKINPGSSKGPFDLGLIDVYKIRGIYVGTTYSTSNPDRSAWFTLDNGQTPEYYDHASLILKPQYKDFIDSSTRILIELDHFTANTTPGIGYFSINSYPVRQIGEAANTTNIEVAEIPTYNNLDLRNSVDFRMLKYNTANSATIIANATENPSVSNTSFNVPAAGLHVIEPDSNFETDFEYYLPRIDILSISADGTLNVKKGIPSLAPRTPTSENDVMDIAKIKIPAYPSLTSSEAALYNREDLKISSTIVMNKGYSMKDIGTLDQRISDLEYYVSLNTLEQKTKDISVTDENGLDRFKNGIFADPLINYNLGKTTDPEYSVVIDVDNEYARPVAKQNSFDFVYSAANSVNIQQTNRNLSLPYINEKYLTQPYASKLRNLTQSYWKWSGEMNLYPSYDCNVSNETNAENVINSNSTNGFGSSWRTSSTTTTTTVNVGNVISDVSLNPYIASKVVAFIAYGMKPNSKLYAFFDGVNVTDYCAQGTINPGTYSQGNEYKVVNKTGSYGAGLVSDSSGTVAGWFNIPGGTFLTGDRYFELFDVDNLVIGADASLTNATARYTASNLSVTTSSVTVTTTTTSSTSSWAIVGGQSDRQGNGAAGTNGDPLCQSFFVENLNNTTGMYIPQVGVYFKTKDQNLGVTCYILEMSLGVPDNTKVVAKTHLNAASISTSADASQETVFVFDTMPYLTTGNWYALMLQPDGNSPNYQVWVSEVGGNDINSGQQIFSNIFSGVLFVSANQNTWTSIQTEDLKCNIYSAKFTSLSGNAYFYNDSIDIFSVNGFTYANNNFTIAVGDVVYTQNSSGYVQTSNISPRGIITEVSSDNNRLIIDNSNGLFAANNILQIHKLNSNNVYNANTLVATSTIQTIDDIEYDMIVPRFAQIEPQYTSINYLFYGKKQNYIDDTTYTSVQLNNEHEFLDAPRYFYSKSNQTANSESASSVLVVNLTTASEYVAPSIDLVKKNGLYLTNIINNDLTDEYTKYGNALAKEITKNITLAEGQDAEDLLVYISAFRPQNTDITVYCKLLNNEDPDTFDSKNWSIMKCDSKAYSDPLDRTNFVELQYYLPSTPVNTNDAYLNVGNSGIVRYVSASGSVYDRFKTYALKIVLTSTSSNNIPLLDDIRAIALQK